MTRTLMTPRVVALCMVAAGTFLLVVGGCSTATRSDPPPMPEVPEYTRLTHPPGVLISDLRAWEAGLPAGRAESLKDCDAPYQTLAEKAGSKEEIAKGVQELLDQDAKKCHECFYLKLAEVTREVDSEKTIQERQKLVLKTYAYLSAMARGFQDRFHDTRYRRWALASYRKHSERVFFRRLEITPETTSDLVGDTEANGFTYFTPERQPQTQVLEKYGLVEKRAPASAPEAVADPNIPAAPIAEPAAPPTPSVVEGEMPPPLDP